MSRRTGPTRESQMVPTVCVRVRRRPLFARASNPKRHRDPAATLNESGCIRRCAMMFAFVRKSFTATDAAKKFTLITAGLVHRRPRYSAPCAAMRIPPDLYGACCQRRLPQTRIRPSREGGETRLKVMAGGRDFVDRTVALNDENEIGRSRGRPGNPCGQISRAVARCAGGGEGPVLHEGCPYDGAGPKCARTLFPMSTRPSCPGCETPVRCCSGN